MLYGKVNLKIVIETQDAAWWQSIYLAHPRQAQVSKSRILENKNWKAPNETKWGEKGKDGNFHKKHKQRIFVKYLSLDTGYSSTHIFLLNYNLKYIFTGIIINKVPLSFGNFVLYLVCACIQWNMIIFISSFSPSSFLCISTCFMLSTFSAGLVVKLHKRDYFKITTAYKLALIHLTTCLSMIPNNPGFYPCHLAQFSHHRRMCDSVKLCSR